MNTIASRCLCTLLCFFLWNANASSQQPFLFPGSTQVNAAAAPQSVVVSVASEGTVDQVKVVTRGSEDQDFQITSESCKGRFLATSQACTVTVGFTPHAPGERLGAIILLDRDKHVLASHPLAGSGVGAIATFVPGVMNTAAGNGSRFGFSGDGAPATNASLFLPFGAVLDGAGNLYIADTYNNRIRVVNAQTKIISTFAGNGNAAYTGDGGLAKLASLNNPTSVSIDAIGNLYISDTHNNVVRKVDAFTGTISTIAGNGTAAFSGDSGPATSASLRGPNGISLDVLGNLYIADTGNNVIRKVSAASGIISTVAGSGAPSYRGDGGPATSATLNGPWGVTVTSSGQLYISDQNNHVIRLVNPSGVISTIVGNGLAGSGGDGGLASASRLNTPSNVVIDVAGDVYISDTGNNRIQKINPATSIVTTIAGFGGFGDGYPATLGSLYGPYGIALDQDGSLYIADSGHNRVRVVRSNQAVLPYPTMRLGSVSAPLDQIIENDGTSGLDITSTVAVTNAQLDPATTCNAGTMLAPLGQCIIAADYAPSAIGVNGSIVTDSDALNEPNTLTLFGTVQSTYPSTVLLSSSPNPSIVNDAVVFNVQVINAGNTVPTGKITLLDGTTTIATLQLTNGLASISISNLTVGQHSITAAYPGDANDSGSTSLPLLQVVNVLPPNASTSTSLSSSANPVSLGSTLTLTATVAAVAPGQPGPSGSVTFMEGTAVLATVGLNSSTATFSISTLTAGSHLLTAVYGGSGIYTSSTSPVLTQVVVAPDSVTTTSLTSNADPIAAGSPLVLVATVAPATAGQAAPTGTVTFMDGATSLGTSNLASGVASLTVSNLSVGTHLITATYGASSTYSTSTSPILTEIVVSISNGNSPQFIVTITPQTLSLKSGDRTTLQLTVTTLSTFIDTLSFGCAGLPPDATCTFSQPQLAVSGGVTKNLSLILDTGNPLGAGSVSRLSSHGSDRSSMPLICLLPAGGLLLWLFGGKRRNLRAASIMLALTFSTAMLLSGCGSSTYTAQTTPAGSYTFQVFSTGSGTGATYTVPVQLTVTK